MTAGFARSLPSLRFARPALRRAARLALMLGPMIGPLAGTDARASGPPVIEGVQAPPWWARGDERPTLRRGAFSPVGSEPRPTAVAALAATIEETATPAETAGVVSEPTAPAVRRRPAAIEWGWASRSGLAVHPVRRIAVAGAPRLPSLAAALDAPADPPALAAPDPLPTFAALVPPASGDHVGPKAKRVPLIAGRPASPAKRQARRARRGRLAVGPNAEPGAVGEQASAAALLRFLSATEPGIWAAPAARTAELNRATGTIRR